MIYLCMIISKEDRLYIPFKEQKPTSFFSHALDFSSHHPHEKVYENIHYTVMW